MSDLVGSIARARFERDFGSEHSWDSVDESEREFYLAVVRYDLIALEKAGYRIVPVEPTEEMWRAGTDSLKRVLHSADGIYREMLAAAPKVSP